MLGIYRAPLRVYLLLGALAAWGLASGLGLSISLFPMANQTAVGLNVSYGSYSSRQFFDSVGRDLEASLQKVKSDGVAIEKFTAEYGDRSVEYTAKFGWGASPDDALKNLQTTALTQLSTAESAVRDSLQVYYWNNSGGNFFVTFYSPLRSLDEVYEIVNPILTPIGSRIADAGSFGLWNPNQKEVSVRLLPEKLAQYRISTRQVELALSDSIYAYSGGALQLGEREYSVQLPKKASNLAELSLLRVSPVGQEPVLLKDVAKLELVVSEESTQTFRTTGVESLILFARPKEGGNVKRMADEVVAELALASRQWPADIQHNVLVNPSETINRSISGVLKEVGLAAFLAVAVLFLFIGSFRNVVTAAIEIPLSLLLAFILMKLTGMNLNLISLGGLALSAGMNVDASVVVLENIFRHFHGKPRGLSYEEKAKILVGAVNEVKLPIIASTLASLVVFLPLVFTRGLTNALLGDLAKAVIFSHGLSAVVALVLVPTIRLQLMKHGDLNETPSRFEPWLQRIEGGYERALRKFLASGRAQVGALVAVAVTLPLLIATVVPRLEKEVIGQPQSEWLIIVLSSPLSTTTRQISSEIEALELDINQRFADDLLYTLSQTNNTSSGNVMIRLKDRRQVTALMARAEEAYKNTPTRFYHVVNWSPSELRIPEAADFRLEITGGDDRRRHQVANDLAEALAPIYSNLETNPPTAVQKSVVVEPLLNLTSQPEVISRFDLSHLLRVATSGVKVDDIYDRGTALPIYLRMPKERGESLEALSSLPIGFEEKIIPVSAIARVSIREKEPSIYRENQQTLHLLEGKVKKSHKDQAEAKLVEARAVVAEQRAKLQGPGAPLLVEAKGDQALQDALEQLKWAVLLSIALIFLTMVLQLGDLVHSLLVLVAIPLGIIGVLVSLFVFGSTLSLNSGLGTILLNGLAVANSIILVDFIRKQFAEGLGAFEATVTASVARLRPILMTSLCTVLGMFPIALGLGEGGKTLQPLGIAVCGGLWLSMSLTIFLVPSLQYQYLRRKKRGSP